MSGCHHHEPEKTGWHRHDCHDHPPGYYIRSWACRNIGTLTFIALFVFFAIMRFIMSATHGKGG